MTHYPNAMTGDPCDRTQADTETPEQTRDRLAMEQADAHEREMDAYVASRIALGKRDQYGNPRTKAEADLMAAETRAEAERSKAQLTRSAA